MRGLAERAPLDLDSEQIVLSNGQVNCGVNAELWDAAATSDGRSIYHLTQKARDLQFSDDVYDHDPDYSTPFTQVRGKFNLGVITIISARDGDNKETKLVRANLGIKLNHFCFPNPLQIMGISKGRFTSKLPPTLIFQNSEDGWTAVKLLH